MGTANISGLPLLKWRVDKAVTFGIQVSLWSDLNPEMRSYFAFFSTNRNDLPSLVLSNFSGRFPSKPGIFVE